MATSSAGARGPAGVMRSSYAGARTRHAAARAEAYAFARMDAIEEGVCGPDLRFGDIDALALQTWTHTWTGVHPSGAGKWNWEARVDQLPRRPAVLPMAIWHGQDLCGLAVGQASRKRATGVRHTVTLTFVERRPEPPDVPLRERSSTWRSPPREHTGSRWARGVCGCGTRTGTCSGTISFSASRLYGRATKPYIVNRRYDP